MEIERSAVTSSTSAAAAAAHTMPTAAAAAVPHAGAARRPVAAAAASMSVKGESKRKADSSSSPSYVFLRIKRRRNENPLECLVVQQEPEAKKQATCSSGADTQSARTPDAGESSGSDGTAKKPSDSADLLSAFTKLSTREKSFVFKRIDTMEKHQLEDASAPKWTERLKRKVKAMKDEPRAALKKSGTASVAATAVGQSLSSQLRAQQQQERLRERRKSDAQRSRGLSGAAAVSPPVTAAAPSIEIKQQQTLELPGIRLVDLETVRQAPSLPAAIDDAQTHSTSGVTLNGARLRPARVLNPREREVDEAIWCAFRENDFSRFFRIFHIITPESKLNPVAFQRPADGSTILMAAAMHGRVDVIEVVLRSSSASALVQDWEGATAAAFAARSGFSNVQAALLACEDAEREKDFVYDVYCVDVSASKDHGSGSVVTAAASAGSGASDGTENAPVVAVSASVQRWLAQDANWNGESDRVEEYMLASDADSQSDDDGESVDSNDENHADNDYPDEESDGYDSDDSEQSTERRRIWARRPSDEGETKDDDELDY